MKKMSMINLTGLSNLILGMILATSFAYTIRMREDKECSLYIGFDRFNSANLFDDSGHNNKATLENGATVTKVDGSCGMCAQLTDGEVVFDGKTFTGIPKTGITIALMINLQNTIGAHEIFQTVGDHSDHNEGQYHLEIIDGKIRWFHRNEKGETVFSAETVSDVIKPKQWHEIAVTYSADEGISKIFCDGTHLKEEISDKMVLSQDWGAFAGIGNFKGDRELKGYLDEFYIFNRTLNSTEIKDIHEHCKGAKSAKVMSLSFETNVGNATYDSSYQGNNGYFTGEFFLGNNGTCGHAVGLPASTNEDKLNVISVHGFKFRNKPTDACTIALWVKLQEDNGIHKLFYTTGGHSMHTHEQYDLSVHNGAIHWIHRNEYDQQIFGVHTEPIVVKDEWTHIAATYNSTKEIAVIYVNGEIKEGKNGVGALSEDWDGIAAFGHHNGEVVGGKPSLDFFDEIEMYDRELSPLEIRQLFMKCSDALNYGMRSTIPSKKTKIIHHKPIIRRKRDLEHQAQLVYITFDRIAGDKVYDDSGYGNNGHLIGMAKLARDVGKCGHGLRFQGGNLLLNGHLMKNIPKNGITIALWVYMDTVAGQQEIFQTIDPKASTNKHGMFYLEANDGHIRWFHRNENSETIFSIETKEKVIQPEVWIHLGVTYDVQTKKAFLYGNGNLIQSDTGTGAMSSDWEGRVSIGKFYDTAENGDYLEGRSFQGILDEIFIYNRALSQIEISRLSQICDFRRVVMYYKFENIKGNLIYDQSGLANFGHIVNTSPTVRGYCGRALNFSSESYIELHGDEFRQKPANAISISVWIHLNTNRDRHQLFNTIGSRSLHKHDQFDFSVINGQIKWFHRDHLGKTVFDLETYAVARPRQWIHLIATYDSQESKAQVYLDGHLVKEVDGTGYLSQDWGHFAGIGKHYYENRYFSGAIDELTMFNYALPSDEIEYVHKRQCDDASVK